MKKYIFLICIALTAAYCKTKKKTGDTTVKKEGAAGAKSELQIAQQRWPGTSSADLNEGKTIYNTKCTRCHGAKKIVTRDEKSWKASIDKMAPRAKLTADEKEKLTRYILSYREAHTTTD